MSADIQAIKELLTVLQGVPLSAWDHGEENLPLNPDGSLPKCGFCVGHVAAHTFGITYTWEDFPEAGSEVNYDTGADAIAEAVGLSREELELKLYKYGAPEEPFGLTIWEKNPHDIILAMVDGLGIMQPA